MVRRRATPIDVRLLYGRHVLHCNWYFPSNSLLIEAREVKRLDAILRSHVYAHFGETLTGLMTIRAYRKQTEFSRITEHTLDVMNRAYFVTIVNQR